MLRKITDNIIYVLTLIFMTALAGYSLFRNALVNRQTLNERAILIWSSIPNIIYKICICLATVIALKFIAKWSSRKLRNNINTLFIISLICCGFSFIVGATWLYFCPYVPGSDAEQVWMNAQYLLDGTPELIDQEYLNVNVHQKGFSLVLAALIRVLGKDYKIAWGVPALFIAITYIAGIIYVAQELFHSRTTGCVAAIIGGLFLPIPIYAVFVYPTLAANCIGLWVLIAAMMLTRQEHIKWYVIITAGTFLMLMIYKGAMVCPIAAGCILLWDVYKNLKTNQMKSFRSLMAILGIIICVFSAGKFEDAVFAHYTGIVTGIGSPIEGWIVSGIAVTDRDGVVGTGSYNSSMYQTFLDTGEDPEATKLIFREQIASAIRQYVRHERSAKDFWLEKTAYQWLNPTFSAIGVTCQPAEVGEWPFFDFVRHGLDILEPIACGLLTMIYLMAIAGLFRLRKQKDDIDKYILAVYFIGGFLLQLVWEQKARYCFPYFVALIPLAAGGITSHIGFLMNFIKCSRERQN